MVQLPSATHTCACHKEGESPLHQGKCADTASIQWPILVEARTGASAVSVGAVQCSHTDTDSVCLNGLFRRIGHGVSQSTEIPAVLSKQAACN